LDCSYLNFCCSLYIIQESREENDTKEKISTRVAVYNNNIINLRPGQRGDVILLGRYARRWNAGSWIRGRVENNIMFIKTGRPHRYIEYRSVSVWCVYGAEGSDLGMWLAKHYNNLILWVVYIDANIFFRRLRRCVSLL